MAKVVSKKVATKVAAKVVASRSVKLSTLEQIDRELAEDAFAASSSNAKLEDKLIKKAKEWNDNPNARTKAAQDKITLSLKVGLEAGDYAASGKYKLPRGMTWIGFAAGQRDLKGAKIALRVADFERFRNASQSYVSWLLDKTYLKSSATRGRKKGEKGPQGPKAKGAKAPKPVPVPAPKVETVAPLYDVSRLPLWQNPEPSDGRGFLVAQLTFIEDAAAANPAAFGKSQNALQTLHKVLAALKG